MSSGALSAHAVRVTIRSIVATGRGAGADAVGETGDPPRRVFVAGFLPCGECGFCRRAVTAACRAPRWPLEPGPGGQRPGAVEVPDRFLVPIDEGTRDVAVPGGQPRHLDDSIAAHAGLGAEILGAAARAGLGAGQTAIWIGGGLLGDWGAFYSHRRGCRSFRLAPDRAGSTEGVVRLPAGGNPGAWGAAVAAAEASAGAGPERRIFVLGRDRGAVAAALSLCLPGSTLSLLDGAPASLAGLDLCAPLRILLGGGCHPDLVTEALAALRRGDFPAS